MNSHPLVPACLYHALAAEGGNPTADAFRPGDIDAILARAQRLSCDAVLAAPPSSALDPYPGLIDHPDHPMLAGESSTVDVLTHWISRADAAGTKLFLDIDVTQAAVLGRYVAQWRDAYEPAAPRGAHDPRLSHFDAASARLRYGDDDAVRGVIGDWAQRLNQWTQVGIHGFRLRHLDRLTPNAVACLVQAIRTARPGCAVLGDTPGLTPWALAALAASQLDGVLSSLPWWNGRAPWLVEEFDRLRAISPCVVAPAALNADVPLAQLRRTLWTAALVGDSVLVRPQGDFSPEQDTAIAEICLWRSQSGSACGPLRVISPPAGSAVALLRTDGAAFATAQSQHARLLLINPDTHRDAEIDWALIRERLPDAYGEIQLARKSPARARMLPAALGPGECLLAQARRASPVLRTASSSESRQAITDALAAPRIAIEAISPVVDNGRFALKRTLGESVEVQADVFMDGHDHIAVQVLWRASDEIGWHRVPMALDANDRYIACFTPTRLGRHEFKICAWRDAWDTYRDELHKKSEAGLNVALELEEGRQLIHRSLSDLPDGHANLANTLSALLDEVGYPQSAARPKKGRKAKSSAPGASAPSTIAPMDPAFVARLLADSTAHAMAAAGHQPFASESDRTYAVNVERQAARFSSWYELFPRSMSGTVDRHGSFDDVIARLPAIRDMGFDTLYFPPIHPIGLSNRKGKNNTLGAGADQPGSPYAIGSADGGHTAVHPELGSLTDFERLVTSAREHGLEIALDFAIQCSPDHPWLKEHPDWFSYRADGSMRYAENPPKKYQDIVNVDFYSGEATPTRQAALWRALRDAVLFWAERGVRAFRVDNPHTKPLPFWEWMIAEVQARFPDALFLSEAFTRPKMMYRLAKLGFSQSYTYFTWRENKAELSAYLRELNDAPAADIFRPHFFVNTPDINPHFLQRSGRAGHLIRMALATTTSGLWGMYSGFELCEATPLPGKEEYLDSEKFQIRVWDWQRPGNIVAELTVLNRLRRRNPALQSHLGLHLLTAHNDQVLYFAKATAARDSIVVVAISLDPFHPQSAAIEAPLWLLGQPDDAAIAITDLVRGNNDVWRGKHQWVHLSPEQPYAIWRIDGMAE